MNRPRHRWIPFFMCAALLLPGLHVHPNPPPAAWTQASATTYATDIPCLACSFSREGRTLPVAALPAAPAAAEQYLPQRSEPRRPTPRPRRAGPLPARGPPAA